MLSQIVIAMCIISVNLDTENTSSIVTQVDVLNSDNEIWTVDVYRSLSEGGYDMNLNSGIRSINSNDCLVIK